MTQTLNEEQKDLTQFLQKILASKENNEAIKKLIYSSNDLAVLKELYEKLNEREIIRDHKDVIAYLYTISFAVIGLTISFGFSWGPIIIGIILGSVATILAAAVIYDSIKPVLGLSLWQQNTLRHKLNAVIKKLDPEVPQPASSQENPNSELTEGFGELLKTGAKLALSSNHFGNPKRDKTLDELVCCAMM